MVAHLDCAPAIGAKVMRVVGSSRRFRHLPHGPQLDGLARMFGEAVKAAEDHGIRLAIENHIDFTAEEILRLIERVGSPFLGVTFDTGNCVRLLDHPVKGAALLAKHCYATHVKDLKVQKGAPADAWYFFSSVPLGEGFVEIERIVETLVGAGYDGLLAVEVDFLHPEYGGYGDGAVETSVRELRRIVGVMEGSTDF